MRIPFSATIKDETTGAELYDVECEIDASLDWDNGEPVAVINAVYAPDSKVSMFRSGSHLFRFLAAELASAAENDDAVLAKLLEAEGAAYVSRGANDPQGHWAGAH